MEMTKEFIKQTILLHRNHNLTVDRYCADQAAEAIIAAQCGTQAATTANSQSDAIAAILGALRIESLWLPKVIDEEHKGEAEALHAMRNSFLSIAQQQHT
ncbi:MAG: hypothetical protein IMZ61_02110 [Planctomycetes bacterium]|nr:hypothetical protein [Planctomycetota bacterium]